MINTDFSNALPAPEDDDEAGRLPRPLAALLIFGLSTTLWAMIVAGLRSL